MARTSRKVFISREAALRVPIAYIRIRCSPVELTDDEEGACKNSIQFPFRFCTQNSSQRFKDETILTCTSFSVSVSSTIKTPSPIYNLESRSPNLEQRENGKTRSSPSSGEAAFDCF